MPRTAYIVHGYNVRNPARLFRLQSFLTTPVVMVDYGWTGLLLGLLRVRFITPREAGRLASIVQPGDVGIGHSNGAAVLAEACARGAPFERLILLNPALRVDRLPEHPALRRVYVLCADDDWVVEAGRWLRRLSPLRLIGKETPWGAMGRRGYIGPDPRGINIRLRSALAVPGDESIGHSGAYRWDRLHRLGPLVHRLATASIPSLDQEFAPHLLDRAA